VRSEETFEGLIWGYGLEGGYGGIYWTSEFEGNAWVTCGETGCYICHADDMRHHIVVGFV